MMREITPPKEDGGGLAQKVGTVCKRHIADERATKASIGPMDGRRVLPLSQKHSIPINNAAHRRDKGYRWLAQEHIDHPRYFIRQEDIIVHAPLQELPLCQVLERHKVLCLGFRHFIPDIAHAYIILIRLHQLLGAVIRRVVTDNDLNIGIRL